MQDKNWASVKKRLLRLVTYKKVKGIRGLAAFIGVAEGRLYTWVKRNEVVDADIILGKIPEVSRDWLVTGNGEPFPEKSPGNSISRTRIERSQVVQSSITGDLSLGIDSSMSNASQDNLAPLFREVTEWLSDKEQDRPGFSSWFAIEFCNRFPEFEEWKKKVRKSED